MTNSEKVEVALGNRSYQIHIGGGLLAAAGDLVSPILKRPVTAVVTDENVAALHLQTLEKSLASAGIKSSAVVLPAGEASKSFRTFEQVTDKLLSDGIERGDTIIAFGGGVIGDLTGFAAAVLRRGVAFVQIPTTLLAQVDSSVGGKTAINSSFGKNLIGVFHQPVKVIADVDLLSTLPKRELLAGYAEVVKYGIIGDEDFFAWLENNGAELVAGNVKARSHAVRRSCEAKAAIVAKDERESGLRALLNLGHTFGHALEAATGYSSRLLHGEGVAIGMVLALRYSEKTGQLKPGNADRVETHLRQIGLPTRISDIPGDAPDAGKLLRHMYQDKKVQDGALTLVLAKEIGNAFVTRDVDGDNMLSFLTDMVRL